MKRPTTPSTRPRAYHLGVRLTQDEEAALLARASELGCSLSELARAALLSVPLDPRRFPPLNRDSVEQLARLGNNLNQLVKLLHEGRAPVGIKSALTDLLAKVETLREELHLSAQELAGQR